MRLPPRPRHNFLKCRWKVDGVVKPAVPCRGHHRGFRNTMIDHPAPFESEAWINLAAFGAVISVAQFVDAHVFAIAMRPQLGAKRLAVPPGKELEKEVLHARNPVERRSTREAGRRSVAWHSL